MALAYRTAVELPEGFTDAVYVHTTIVFDWKDKLKILLGFKVELRTVTLCEISPGKTRTDDVRLSVYRPRNLPQGWGAVEAKNDEPANPIV